MGESSSTVDETLVCILPFPEPVELLKSFRLKHPHLTVIYEQMAFRASEGEMWKITKKLGEDLFQKATILCTLGALPDSPEKLPNVKFIHFFSAGINHISSHPIYTHSGITLTTSSGIHGPMIAEWVVLQILANSHKEKLLLEWQRERKWGNYASLLDLKDSVGMRIGVLGYGSIGRQVARVCKAMGFDIFAYTANPRKTPESKRDTGYIVPGTGDEEGVIPSKWFSGLDRPSLHEFLGQDLDVILISVPLTKETTHFLSDEEFKILGEKRNAFVINISRGAIVDQEALLKYLKLPLADGGLRGAALDVTDPEPLPADSELWGLENVAITPHISGLSVAYTTRSFEILDRNIGNLETGHKLINVVNRKQGY